MIKSLRVLLLLTFILNCVNLKPTPLLFGELVKENNAVHESFITCENLLPECDKVALLTKVEAVREKAKIFIAQDIKQPQGYDIYLEVSLIYIQIADTSKGPLDEAERIARQFFEIQKASGGYQLTDSRYYWAVFLAEYSAWKINTGEGIFTEEEKANLRLCYNEGVLALSSLETGPKRVRLAAALQEVIEPILETF